MVWQAKESLYRPVARRVRRLLRHSLNQNRPWANNTLNAFSELKLNRSTDGGDPEILVALALLLNKEGRDEFDIV